MQVLSRLELDDESVELLPRREALCCASGGNSSNDNNETNQIGLVNFNSNGNGDQALIAIQS